jgi:predicted AAA+ superfamily ATPase
MSNNDLQLSIMVPISSDALQHMTAEEIVQRLSEGRRLDQLEAERNLLRNAIHSYGKSLELILDEVNDPYDRAQALRELVKDMVNDE